MEKAEQIHPSIRQARAYVLEGGEQILRGRLDEVYSISTSLGATALATLALLLLGSKYKKNYQAGIRWLQHNRRNRGWSKVPDGEPDEEITLLVKKVFMANRSGRLAHFFLPGQLREVANIVLALGQDVVPGMVGPQADETALPQILEESVLMKLPGYGRPVAVAAALLAAEDLAQDGVAEAVAYLCGCQMGDGSWSEDIVVTGLTLIALARAKIQGENVDRAGQWLASRQYVGGAWPAFDQLFTWSVGLAVRRFMEFSPSAAEQDWIERAIPWLIAAQNTDGSYGSTPPWTQPDLDDTAVALMALQRIGSAGEAAARRSAYLLKQLQNEEGSWATFPSFRGQLPEVTCAFPVYISSVDVTVHVLDALWGMEGAGTPAASQGAYWLLAQQRPSGDFPGTWYEGPVYATAQVLEFFAQRAVFWWHWRSADRIMAVLMKAFHYLVEHQNADGSWGYSVCETSLAVSALCSAGRPLPPGMLAKGVDAILTRQSADGSFQPSYRAVYAKGWNYEEPLTTALTAITALERYKLMERVYDYP